MEFVSLCQVDAGSKHTVVSNISFEKEESELSPAHRSHNKESVEGTMGRTRVSSLPDSSAREWREPLGRKVKE